MRRHDFDPGRLVLGLVLLGGCLAYLAAARGWWHFPAYLLLPVLAGGLCVAGVASSLTLVVRRRRADRGEGGRAL
ncbi:hypothetical protein FHS39_000798 [Streptomyces olivoverticillatus]|uniref:Uncharacterized protein n=1 Tax=Streptomyces olivoverticillatus TaxID=66427 RepID=A0A7W7PJV8_9ACTN|nr:hypothetical protein [Streptomyces olivoverticillatus]MBB4891798.1 hypothetical protein [Streptomyces olivoverticillatus]